MSENDTSKELQLDADIKLQAAYSFEELEAEIRHGFSDLQEQLLEKCNQVFLENEHLRSCLNLDGEPGEDPPTPRSIPAEGETRFHGDLEKPRDLVSGSIDSPWGNADRSSLRFRQEVVRIEATSMEANMKTDLRSASKPSSDRPSASSAGQVEHRDQVDHGSEQPIRGMIHWPEHANKSPLPEDSKRMQVRPKPSKWLVNPEDVRQKDMELLSMTWDSSRSSTPSKSQRGRQHNALEDGKDMGWKPCGSNGASYSDGTYNSEVISESGSSSQVLVPEILGLCTRDFEQNRSELPSRGELSRCNSMPIGDFVLRDVLAANWETDASYESGDARISGPRRVSMIVETDGFDEGKRDCTSRRLVVYPNSFLRLLWDYCGALLIGYDIVTVPLAAFQMHATHWQQLLTYVTAAFWTVDFLLCFITGVVVDGLLEMRVQQIVRKYLQSWCIPDAIVVVLDWTDILITRLELQGSRGNMGMNWIRILRPVVRIFRLVRLCKLVRILRSVTDRLNSEIILMLMQIFRLVIVILLLNHYLACAWYGIGILYDHSNTWVVKHVHLDEGILYKYLTSLHWSLTQFTPASMEVFPTNEIERLFNVGVVIFGLITFSSFVSSITSAMARLASLRDSRHREETQLRKFLSQKNVSVQLGAQIRKFFRENYEVRMSRVHEFDITFFTELPVLLRVALHAEIYMPVTCLHPLFKSYCGLDFHTMSSICHFAVNQRTQPQAQNIFLTGSLAEGMQFVVSGEVLYHNNKTKLPHACSEGHWLSEGALWGSWYHRGRLSADSNSEMVFICPDTFCAITSERQISFKYLQMYARHFQHEVLVRIDSDDPVTDLPLNIDVLQDLVHKTFGNLNQKRKKKGRD